MAAIVRLDPQPNYTTGTGPQIGSIKRCTGQVVNWEPRWKEELAYLGDGEWETLRWDEAAVLYHADRVHTLSAIRQRELGHPPDPPLFTCDACGEVWEDAMVAALLAAYPSDLVNRAVQEESVFRPRLGPGPKPPRRR